MKLLQIFAFVSLASSLAGASTFELKPGEPFPEIPLPQTAGGDLMSIADFRGEKLMLHLFASW